MVYKVVGNINDENFMEILTELQQYNRLIYKNGNIYIALDKYEDFDKNRKKLDEFKLKWKKKDVFVYGINEYNLKSEEKEIEEWCKDNFVRLDKRRYEINEQPRLKRMYEAVDLFEQILKEYQKGGKNGETYKV